ncbi:Gfo/Idh/MocA family protein [Ruania alba]|uniref:Predicted dehydrogenase n=1 Tax=Ruania alba TaxID=648782 RepID=A0A1H5MQ99_9MICO|nr:Gfo/Idh/MocA family oxidoreductase [Ruania alba]SEE91466.1 Predicted dehydrogenase [Ruania alba]
MTIHDLTYGPDPADAPPLRWGILAAGGIAAKFAQDVPAHSSGSVVAVGSRSLERAQAFAEKHQIPTAYGNYADLVADEQVEAVYVASPHSEHLEHAMLAIEAGKPVLVEKSLTRNAVEARELFEAAKARGVFVMEAMWSRLLPHMVALREIIASGEIGEVHMVTAEHGQWLNHVGDDHRLKNPDLAGGAMLDLGVYPVSFAYAVLGAPDQISAIGTTTATGVDESDVITLRYGNRALALLGASLKGGTRNAATVTGTQGRVEIEPTFFAPTTLTVRPQGGEPRTLTPPVGGGFEYQAAEVARCVAAGRTESEVHSWADTIAVMEMMDEARRQFGVVLPGE